MFGQNAPISPPSEFTERVLDLQSRVAELERAAVGKVVTNMSTTGIVAGSGWQVNDYVSWRLGAMLQFRIRVERTGAGITITASGNIGNQTVATLPASERGTVSDGLPLVGGAPAGRVVAASYTPSTGVLQIGSLGGTSNFATNEQVDIGGMVYVG